MVPMDMGLDIHIKMMKYKIELIKCQMTDTIFRAAGIKRNQYSLLWPDNVSKGETTDREGEYQRVLEWGAE